MQRAPGFGARSRLCISEYFECFDARIATAVSQGGQVSFTTPGDLMPTQVIGTYLGLPSGPANQARTRLILAARLNSPACMRDCMQWRKP